MVNLIKRRSYVWVGLLICLFCLSCEEKEANELVTPTEEQEEGIVYPANKYQVGGYLRERLISKAPANLLDNLTHLYLIGEVFADKDEIVKFNNKAGTVANIQKLKQQRGNRNTKIILSVAGKFKSTVFLFAKDKAKREIFINTLLDFCLENGLDGIDMDTEHPETVEEVAVMEQLSKELYEAFHPKGLLVSHAIIFYNTRYAKAVLPYLDWINLMLYDVFDAKHVHATFETYERDIKRFLNAGIPGEKITAGLPFYGVNVTPDRTQRKQLSYRHLINLHGNSPFDPSADLLGGIWAINGVKTIAKKVRYAAENELNGVMIWSMSLDFETTSEKSLLKSILGVTPVDNQ